MTTQDRLLTILEDQFGYENVAPETTLAELGADSLDLAELEMSVEVEFDVELELREGMSVEDVVKLVEEKQ